MTSQWLTFSSALPRENEGVRGRVAAAPARELRIRIWHAKSQRGKENPSAWGATPAPGPRPLAPRAHAAAAARLLLLLAMAVAAWAGTVSGRAELANSRDASVRKNRNYAGVVVWLEPVARSTAIPQMSVRVKMLQKEKRFVPHVLAIQVGSTVDFPNLDPIFHNAFSNFSGQPFDVGLYAPGTSRAVAFRHPGIVRVFCNIHSTMSAVIAVLRTPWFAVTDNAGTYRIASVPGGEYRLQVFHERALPETLNSLDRRIAVGDSGLDVPVISISEAGYIPGPHLNKHGMEYPPVPSESLYPGSSK